MSLWSHWRQPNRNSLLPEWKEKVLSDFREWVLAQPDEVFADTVVDECREPDLLTLLSELTSIRQEVRGMGRTAAGLSANVENSGVALRDEVAALNRKLEEESAALTKLDERQDEKVRIKRNTARPLLLELADLAEALQEVSERQQELDWPGYVPGFVRTRVESSINEPLGILKMKAAAMLQRHNLRELVEIGDEFDASTMNVVGISSDETVSAGCVSNIVRQAYALGNDVLRVAEVIIEEELEFEEEISEETTEEIEL